MNRSSYFSSIALFLIAGACGSAAAVAQSTTQPSVLEMSQPSRGCPVSMRAQQRGLGDMVKVKSSNGQPVTLSQAAQRIRLILSRPESDLLDAESQKVGQTPAGQSSAGQSQGDWQSQDSGHKIVSAKVTVTGISSKGRLVPLADSTASPSGKARTLDVNFVLSGRDAAANLLLEGFTSITSITLKSMTYADGSVWTPSVGSSCRISPDPIMLVSAR